MIVSCNRIILTCKGALESRFILLINGEDDLVVMDIEAFARRESMLRLWENLVATERERPKGINGYSVDEVSAMMKAAVRGTGRTAEKMVGKVGRLWHIAILLF